MRAFVLLLCLLAAPAFAQDFPERIARGKLLYQTYCGDCHYERVHERVRTEVKDLADLRDWVARWAPQTKHRFSLEEREDVVQYLNASHYRIGLATRPSAEAGSGRAAGRPSAP